MSRGDAASPGSGGGGGGCAFSLDSFHTGLSPHPQSSVPPQPLTSSAASPASPLQSLLPSAQVSRGQSIASLPRLMSPPPTAPISYWTAMSVPALSSLPDIQFLPDAVLIVRDGDHRIIECNPIAARMFGYRDRAQLLGSGIAVLIPPDSAADHQRQVRSVFSSMRAKAMGGHRKVRGLRYDGSEFEVSVQLSPATIQVPGFDHYEKVVTCVCRDMTEHNRAVAARMEAEKRNEVMEKFLRLINHEVRTSIHAITNALSTLKSDLFTLLMQETDDASQSPLQELKRSTVHGQALTATEEMKQSAVEPPQQQQQQLVSAAGSAMAPYPADLSAVEKRERWVAAVLSEDGESRTSPKSTLRSLRLLDHGVTAMESLLTNMLDYQTLKDGHFAQQFCVVNSRGLLCDLRDHQRVRWKAKSQLVQVDVDPAVPLVYVESQLLRKVLNALLDNALRHTANGTKIRLSCALRAEESSSSGSGPVALDAGSSDEFFSRRETSADSVLSSPSSQSSRSSSESITLARAKTAYTPTLGEKETEPSPAAAAALQFQSLFQRSTTEADFITAPPGPALTASSQRQAILPPFLSSPSSPSAAAVVEQCALEFRVCDDGEGLTEAALRELEAATFQVDGTTTRSTTGGLGLGFKIATLCTQRLNGTLELLQPPPASPSSAAAERTQETTQWSTVFVLNIVCPVLRFPAETTAAPSPASASPQSDAATAETAVIAAAASSGSAAAESAASVPWDVFSSPDKQKALLSRLLSSEFAAQRAAMRILIVEDNLVNVKVIKQCLTKRDFKTLTVANNGQQAVDATLNSEYDLILMDLEMPVKDGVTASREITGNSSNPNCQTPIIALTANATDVAQRRCLEARMQLYLTKPLNASDLMFSLAALRPFELYPLVYCPHVLRSHHAHAL